MFIRVVGGGDRVARLAVCVVIKISGRIQRIEYESLSVVCFKCGIYEHNTYLCAGNKSNSSESGVGGGEPMVEKIGLERCVEEESYGPWILVEHRQRGNGRSVRTMRNGIFGNGLGAHGFQLWQRIRVNLIPKLEPWMEGASLIKSKGVI